MGSCCGTTASTSRARTCRTSRATSSVSTEAPPRVEYSLTTAGKDLLVPIRALGDWAAVYADQLPTESKP
ncbi:winged helix-turn-helix transcriptional regulator [Kribbella sp. NBC_00709]|uniref:winged helix-turn-helix transcriptional regulator n=1 Tax=Kribbella sp. NBC_00709 TaxID=2975972 RepID=UPI002E2E214A|nr:winged helix-turn-helix transcriptional regulator [Kribbella sp. NBC_00709]